MLSGIILSGITGVSAAVIDDAQPGLIIFQLVDDNNQKIERVSLMKAGEFSKDGRTHQIQNTSFNQENSQVSWNPCNDNECSYASFPTSGGNNGRDELILEITMSDIAIDTSSCYGDPTCERLKGGTSTKSGIINGIFKTGKVYQVFLSSLKPGVGETFTVSEIL